MGSNTKRKETHVILPTVGGRKRRFYTLFTSFSILLFYGRRLRLAPVTDPCWLMGRVGGLRLVATTC
ncbi:unnamed protein product [Arabis nemorensis]|uniref:Uncharacterized protein n=1 Tax=Arabis nemorensis TaxID=586526 RepID=A0A565C268_9BRAS|nr:unnamed protein product [Arabis nemorensis]